MDLLPVFLSFAFAFTALFVRSERWRPLLLPLAGLAHSVVSFLAIQKAGSTAAGQWIRLDAVGALALGLMSVLFLLCSVYAVGYLRLRSERPNRFFCVCFLAFMGMASLVCFCQHLGLLWVSLESATLATAVLIHFNKNSRSIEATWKYLLVGSVGIALALLGTFFLSYAAYLGGYKASLLADSLLPATPDAARPWLRAGFVLLLVGYGTKMGLAPLHAWKPDAYGEAPGLVGALLAGVMTNCAFLSLLRGYEVVGRAGEGAFARDLLMGIGLVSIGLAAVFVAKQKDFKRMLAYSSVEHMGILVLGIGLGAQGVFGALFHMVNNGLAKGTLFLSAGNLHRAYGAKTTDRVAGVIRRLPYTGTLFLLGFLAVTGTPPFGPFLSELTILRASLDRKAFVVASLFVIFLTFVFIGMGATVFSLVRGRPSAEAEKTSFRDGFWMGAPLLISLLLVLGLGIWIPAPLQNLLQKAAAIVEANP